ncbi:hypothetical protein B296_00009342 [Ensete ventricosum]|uniref:Uncharacterized protein n=1 Tax=Ensete ventricosum TaxID=4639 RepID=A0A426YRL6_ENSVE|nr:hypothetical protein B296_00009342 [Ensete ventricosum]
MSPLPTVSPSLLLSSAHQQPAPTIPTVDAPSASRFSSLSQPTANHTCQLQSPSIAVIGYCLLLFLVASAAAKPFFTIAKPFSSFSSLYRSRIYRNQALLYRTCSYRRPALFSSPVAAVTHCYSYFQPAFFIVALFLHCCRAPPFEVPIAMLLRCCSPPVGHSSRCRCLLPCRCCPCYYSRFQLRPLSLHLHAATIAPPCHSLYLTRLPQQSLPLPTAASSCYHYCPHYLQPAFRHNGDSYADNLIATKYYHIYDTNSYP